MAAPVDKLNDGQPRVPHKSKNPGGFLDFLSGLFMAGAIVVGLLFAVIFINPQSRFNPLPPTTLPALFLTYTPSSTPRQVLPPTWTPTISPTYTPTLTPIPTNTPLPTVDNSPTPATDLESGVTFDEQNSSPISKGDTIYADAGCSWLKVEREANIMDSLPVSTQLAPVVGQPRVASALAAPLPKEQFPTEALQPTASISDIFTPEIQYWEEDILAWGEEFDLDPNLIATVMQIESCGYLRALSAAGAKGLFQVMPHYFDGKEDPYDPDINAFKGLSWLRKTLIGGGSYSMALAGYNAGLARATNPYLEWPAETQRYVNWGLGIYEAAKCDYEYSSALYDWLAHGGSSLCNRAATEQQDN